MIRSRDVERWWTETWEDEELSELITLAQAERWSHTHTISWSISADSVHIMWHARFLALHWSYMPPPPPPPLWLVMLIYFSGTPASSCYDFLLNRACDSISCLVSLCILHISVMLYESAGLCSVYARRIYSVPCGMYCMLVGFIFKGKAFSTWIQI